MAYRYGSVTGDAQTLLGYANLPQTNENIAAVAAWLGHENGVNNNPLGVTHPSNGVWVLSSFSSKDAGLKAAANLLASSSNYKNAYNDLKAGNKGSAFVLDIAKSPWSETHYGLKGSDVTTVSWYNAFAGINLGNLGTPGDFIGNAGTAASGVVNAAGGLLDNVQTAIMFVGVVLIGVVFIGGSFYLAKR